MSKKTVWRWWWGYDEEVRTEHHYCSPDFDTRDEAIAAGREAMPGPNGERHFRIVEATFSDDYEEGDEFVPFGSARNEELIDAPKEE